MADSISPTLDPLKQARQRWQQAQAAVSRHALRSDPEIDLALTDNAKHLPAWRGPGALFGSWVLPQVPAFMGATDGFAAAFFVVLGGICLGFAVWFLFKDGTRWYRWSAARRALKRGNYRYRYLAELAGLPPSANLQVIPRESDEWEKLGEWVQRDAQLAAIWKRWHGSNPPIRYWDMRVLEEALFALTKLQDLKAEKPGASPLNAPTPSTDQALSAGE